MGAVVITGGAGGIGAAIGRRFAATGRPVVLADRTPGPGLTTCDVTDPEAVDDLVRVVVETHGGIDLFCSNAGVTTDAGLEAPDDQWRLSYEVNVLAHVHVARALLRLAAPTRLVITASAAGLLTHPGDAAYSATKHAAVGLAEWLALRHGDQLTVQVLCPLGVATPMLNDPLEAGEPGAAFVARSGPVLAPDDVAEAVIEGVSSNRLWILPHPQVARYHAGKASDPDAWLTGMRRALAR